MSQRRVAQIVAERHRPRNPLERLVRYAAMRRAWTAELRAVLPPALAPHCQVASLRDDCLTIHVADASLATRLRLELPKLEPALRSLGDFAAVQTIRVRPAPSMRAL